MLFFWFHKIIHKIYHLYSLSCSHKSWKSHYIENFNTKYGILECHYNTIYIIFFDKMLQT